MAAFPTIYFIDDSATMREVIKIAFRRENMEVLASHDAVSALTEIEEKRPDVVITDVIMPEKDGYEVCQFIKNHPELAKTPVILMSGVVNRAVAERAFSVKADELLRKPFQPQDLIARVRHLLKSNPAPAPTAAGAADAAAALSAIFAPAAAPVLPKIAVPAPSAWASSQPLPELVTEPSQIFAPPAPPVPSPAAIPRAANPTNGNGSNAGNGGNGSNGTNTTKLRVEVLRLEGLIKKLQAELQAEREYSRALEEHIKTLQDAD
jgi:CheY-like chemotaxis protein